MGANSSKSSITDSDELKNDNPGNLDSYIHNDPNPQPAYSVNIDKNNNKNILSNEEDSAQVNSNALRFHQIHGKNVIYQKNSRIAQRIENSFCDAIVFSNRPIDLKEIVYLKIIKLSTLWNGMLRLGFTCVNPNTFKLSSNDSVAENLNEINDECRLPKYVYPNLTNKYGFWAGALPDNQIKENDIVYFFLNSNGEIHYGINGSYRGKFLDSIEVYKFVDNTRKQQQLWAMFDIYGNTLSIELIDRYERQNLNSSDYYNTSIVNSLESASISSGSSSGSSTMSYPTNMITIIPNPRAKTNIDKFDNLLISCRRLCVDNHLNETLHESIMDETGVCDSTDDYPSYQQEQPIDLNVKIKHFYESIPVLLHETTLCPSYKFISSIHGKNVNISQPDCYIAYRESSIRSLKERYLINMINKAINNSTKITNKRSDSRKSPTTNAYVFIDKPIEKGKYFCLQIVGIDQDSVESNMSLGIGCTTCPPNELNPMKDFTNDANDFLDRREYWVVNKNLFDKIYNKNYIKVSLADELCFRIDESSGNLSFYINGKLITHCLFNVDITQKLWFFFDLCGKTNAIRLIPSCQPAIISTNSPKISSDRKKRPNSALINYFKNQLLIAPNELITSDHSAPKSNSSSPSTSNLSRTALNETSPSSNKEECRICWNAPIECVFYSCGHMCVCWKCATLLKEQAPKLSNVPSAQAQNQQENTKSKHPICPICRNEIIDIIRVFKS